MSKRKIRVGVIFGGRSAEHEVSLVSGKSVIEALNKKKYEVIPIGLTKEGKWIIGKPLKALTSGNFKNVNVVTPPTNPREKGLIKSKSDSKEVIIGPIDVLFPVLHGPFGEDGTIQGLLELANIPYVGAGVLGSALGMDKVVQKQIYEHEKIPTPKFVFFNKSDWSKSAKTIKVQIKKQVSYPCFVKPANLGSSIGISKVHKEKQLVKAINLAFKYDLKVLVEKSIENCQEISVSVLGNDKPKVSVPGEIIPCNEFYDYDAKYVDGQSQAIIPAKIPKSVTKKLQEYAKKAFIALNCAGMARVDFLITRRGYKIYLDEVNTIPGFTAISLYPKLWKASGLKYPDLINELIKLAIERHKEKIKLETSYKPKKDWYK